MSTFSHSRPRRSWLAGLIFASAFIFALPVWAESYAVVSASVNLRAGPRAVYPSLYVLQPGLRVVIHGCLDDYSWCDISALDYRGWVYADYLDYNDDNRRVTIADYGPQIGITIIAFSLVDYWSRHYPHRPWYGERHSYEVRYGPHGDRGRPRHAGSRAPDRRPPARIENRSQSRPQYQQQNQRIRQHSPRQQTRPQYSPSQPRAQQPRHTRPSQGPSPQQRPRNNPGSHSHDQRRDRPGQHGSN